MKKLKSKLFQKFENDKLTDLGKTVMGGRSGETGDLECTQQGIDCTDQNTSYIYDTVGTDPGDDACPSPN